MLHITNGDYAADLIKAALSTQDVLAWQDILYEGPVKNIALEELSQMRAKYLASAKYGDFESIEKSFQERDKKLSTFSNHDEVILWFEHDTYDQLQLIQILNWFSHQHPNEVKLSLICINQFPGITPFLGLGQLDAQQIATLFPTRELISAAQFQLAEIIWDAFTASNPAQLVTLLKEDLDKLPYIKNALIRYLREFPSVYNGLTWTEQYALESIASGTTDFTELFKTLPLKEKDYFLGIGDTTFKKIIQNMNSTSNPLLQPDSDELELTPFGNAVLNGKKDSVETNGLDKYNGGVHLRQEHFWRWDDNEMQLHTASNLNKVNVHEKLSMINDYWNPKIAGEINDSYLKLAKFKGEFVWHKHENEDEMFFVIKGNLLIKFRDNEISLQAGEFLIIPRGVEHLPVANAEVHVILLEPKTTLNTGDINSDFTVTKLDRI